MVHLERLDTCVKSVCDFSRNIFVGDDDVVCEGTLTSDILSSFFSGGLGGILQDRLPTI